VSRVIQIVVVLAFCLSMNGLTATSAGREPDGRWIELSELAGMLPKGCKTVVTYDQRAEVALVCPKSRIVINNLKSPSGVRLLKTEDALFLFFPIASMHEGDTVVSVDVKKAHVERPLMSVAGQYRFYRRATGVFLSEYHSCGCADGCWKATLYKVVGAKLERKKRLSCNCDESCNARYGEKKFEKIETQLLSEVN
jgi:hypothetical protein